MELISNNSNHLEEGKPSYYSHMSIDTSKLNGPVKRYYEKQQELIDLLEHKNNEIDDSKMNKTNPSLVTLAINLSYCANVLLLLIKIWALVISGSLAMLASVLDSCLDILSGSVLFFAQRAVENTNKYQYPIGKTRVQPIATIVFACLMGMSALQIFIEALRRMSTGLITHRHPDIIVDTSVYSIVIVTIGLKAVLCVFCRFVAKYNNSSAVDAYAQDHFNDIITNSIGIAGMIIASRYDSAWMVDPVVAMIIALWIVFNWASTGSELSRLIMGQAASPIYIQYLTHIAMHHDERIKAVDTVRAYFMGEGLFVEIDIVLDENMPLKESHDIGESLQFAIESEDDVERCFVHLDYEFSHAPEH